MGAKAAYAEIKRIISDEIKIDRHPFQVGEVYTVKAWNGEVYADKEYTVVKVTDERVTLKSGDEKAIIRKPWKCSDRSNPSGYLWAIRINDGLHGMIYRKNDGVVDKE